MGLLCVTFITLNLYMLFLLCLLSRVFIINGCWIFSKPFSASEMIMWFLIFELVDIWCITLICIYWRIFASLGQNHLIMVYDPFIVLLASVCYNFVEDFCICVHQWYWPVIFLFCVVSLSVFGIGDGGYVEWVWEFSFLCNFLEEFEQYRC